MTTPTSYKNANIHGSPTGAAGIEWDARDQVVADRIGSFVTAASAPTANSDSDNTDTLGACYENTLWKNTAPVADRLYVCMDATPTAAVWTELVTKTVGGDIVLREDDDGNDAVRLVASSSSGAVNLYINGVVTTKLAGSNTTNFINNGGALVVGANSTSSTDPMVVINRTISGGSGNAHAFVDSTSIDRDDNVGFNSFDAKPIITGTANYDHIAGFQARASFRSSGTIARLVGVQSLVDHQGGLATRVSQLEARDYTGGGTATDQHGLYIRALTAGATNHGVHLLNCPDGGSISTADGVDLSLMPAGTGSVGIGTVAPSANADLTLEGGVLDVKETTTPSADVGHGKIYTKNDDKLYFQDGAGAEHEIAFVP